jgi:hypothetical protein
MQSGAVTPRRKDSVARHNPADEVRQIVKAGTFTRNDHVGEQGVFEVHMGTSFNGGDHRHTYVSDVL